jgi:hypothetical protein
LPQINNCPEIKITFIEKSISIFLLFSFTAFRRPHQKHLTILQNGSAFNTFTVPAGVTQLTILRSGAAVRPICFVIEVIKPGEDLAML